MLIGGDYRQNLVRGYDDSVQQILTRTMLNQEQIFRNQVFELHRLYLIQKTLMKELDLKVSDGRSLHSSIGPFSKHLKYETLATEMKLSAVDTMCSSRALKNHCLQEHRSTSKHSHRPLDLELPASHYASDDEDLLFETYGHITPGVSARMRNDAYDDNVSSMEELILSLRANSDTWQKQTCKDKIICSPSQQTGKISLEGSYGGDLVCQPSLGCADHATNYGAKREFVSSCSFRSRNIDAFDSIFEMPSQTDDSPHLPEGDHFNLGVEECNLSCKNTSAKGKLFISHELGELDLNKALPDESSVHLKDHWMSNLSNTSLGVSYDDGGEYGKDTSFTVLDQRRPKNNCSSDPSALGQQDTINSTLTTSPSQDTREHICGSILRCVDLGSVCGSLNKDLVSCSRNFKLKNAECEISFSDKTFRKILTPEMSPKKDKEGKLHSHYLNTELLEGTDSNRSPVSCKSDWIVDDVSSNSKTGQCGIDVSNSNISPNTSQNTESSPLAKKLVQQNVVSSDQKKEELAEVDAAVKMGAMSLICFSLECSTTDQENVPESKKRKESCELEREVPQSSSESFESIVLKQPDCSVNEYCVSSTPLEVTCLDKKDYGIKLRRGRRMKDFRREILPGLASLSRQEICEDIKVMEIAIRSREYKKYNSKNTSKSNCFSSARSRRLRPSHVGRKYYS